MKWSALSILVIEHPVYLVLLILLLLFGGAVTIFGRRSASARNSKHSELEVGPMAKKNAEKEAKPVKEKKTKEKKPKTKKAEKPSKKKKGKGKAEEVPLEAAASAVETSAAEGQEEEKPKKPRRSILEPFLCVLIALLAVFEIFMVFVWLTNPTAEEIRAQLEAQVPRQTWSLSAYSNRHGTYQPPEAQSPVAVYATSNDVPATAQPRVQAQTPDGSADPEPTT